MFISKINHPFSSVAGLSKSQQLTIHSTARSPSERFKPALNVIVKQAQEELKPSILDEPEIRFQKEYIKKFWNSLVLLTRAGQKQDTEDDSYIDLMILNEPEREMFKEREQKLRKSLNILQSPNPPASEELNKSLQSLNINFKSIF